MNCACPLCAGSRTGFYHRDRKRDYWQCERCQFVFVPSEFWLTAGAEKSEYDLHDNQLDDPGYLTFLLRLGLPLTGLLAPGAKGLDFGCGPAPLLAQWLAAKGHEVAVFDKFYAPDVGVFTHSYDFICATEVAEHLKQPGLTLPALWSRLRPGGILALMTKRVLNRQAFSRWHYKNDPTHIGFFSEASFAWLAQNLNASLSFPATDVTFLIRR